jgi:hypothetical protein
VLWRVMVRTGMMLRGLQLWITSCCSHLQPVFVTALTGQVQHVVSERGMEFGIVSPGSAAHPHRHVWMLGSPVTGGSFFSPLQAR